jgi:hypothetical protein
MFQVGLGGKQHPVSKITSPKKAVGMAQVVKLLPHKCEALSSYPSIAKITEDK